MMGKTYRFGLIGYPINHSLSPVLHQAAIQNCGMKGSYQLIPVEDFPIGNNYMVNVIHRVISGELDGVNITIPHKGHVLPLLEELTPAARAVNAVNTIYMKDNILWGDNTDISGFINDLKRIGFENQDDRTVIILGAGGAARAAAWGLWDAGWRVCILARCLQNGQEIVRQLCQQSWLTEEKEDNRLSAALLDSSVLQRVLAKKPVHLVVNATPMGMTSHPQGSAWPVEVPLPRDTVVYDMVYTPPVTELIQLAQNSGLAAYNGLGMLIEQAALAFELWTGQKAPREAMWQAGMKYQEHQ